MGVLPTDIVWMPFSLLLLLLPMCSAQDGHTPQMPGLHNVIRVTDKLLSGSVPEGDAGFQSLRKLGVKTIISVDGATPEVERVRKLGMRYVHLPIGYDGVPAEQGLRLAKAVRDLPGQIYLHCHHGKHRSPAAAAVVKLCLDEQCKVEAALDLMKQAGTDPKFLGLYASPKELKRPTKEELDKVPSDFPETAIVSSLMKSMVHIDERWDNLKLIKAAGWKSPQNKPDLNPAHEALLLLEHYTEMKRLKEVSTRPRDFQEYLTQATEAAQGLERSLSKGTLTEIDKFYSLSQKACTQCHGKYRDVPQK